MQRNIPNKQKSCKGSKFLKIGTLAAIMLLLGSSQALSSKTKLRQGLQKNILAQSQLQTEAMSMSETMQGATHTCAYNINVLKKGPADYKSIIGSGKIYSDPDFKPSSDSIYWQDYNRQALQGLMPYITWSRIQSKYTNPQLFNANVGEYDIRQGQVGDCFWLSPMQSMAQDPDRIKNIFLNKVYPSEGIFAVNLFIKGKPEVITIDDFLPFQGSNPIFAKRSDDGDFWSPLLEKAFAKVNGNYEAIGGGWQSESFRILNGAPSRFYMLNNIDTATSWSVINDALNKGFIVGVDTPGAPPFGLASGHAHAIVGAYQLKDAYGRNTNRLYRIRNPWDSDSYTGPWSDSDSSRWTTFYKSQVPYVNFNDGYFYIEDVDLAKGFYYFTVNFYREGWFSNYYEKLNDDGVQDSYTFTLPTTQEIYIGADFYDPRMYASGCRNGMSTTGNLQLFRGTTLIDQVTFADQLGYGYQYYSSLAAGIYTLKFKATWTPYDVKDYTVSVYSKDQVFIYDGSGKTSNVTQNLKESLAKALTSLSSFTYENGGWYGIRRGFTDTTSSTFFYQVSGPMKVYNMNFTVTLTSTDSTVYSPNNNVIKSVKNTDGTTTFTHFCQILPKQNINECNYMVDVNNGIKFNWVLLAWNYA